MRKRGAGKFPPFLGLVGLCGLALATTATEAVASPADLLGFGPRSQALGATGAATARGFEATYLNPALLSGSTKRELTLGVQTVDFSLHADGAQRQGPSAPGKMGYESMLGTYIGAVLPVPFGGVLKDRLVLGLGAFIPNQLIARARILYTERPQFPVLADRMQTLSFNLGAGLDIGHGIRIGGGAMAIAELVGTVVVQNDAMGRVGTLVDDQLVATFAPVVGATFDITDEIVAGAVWRGELEAEFDIVVQVRDLGMLELPDLHIAGSAQYDPMQAQGEVGYATDHWLFALGATVKFWSLFGGWERSTVQCPDDQPDCDAFKPLDVGFHDTIVPRLGVAYRFPLREGADAALRGGYFFEPTPIPEQRGGSRYWDNDRHVFTLGGALEFGDPLPPISLSLYYQHHALVARVHRETVGESPQDVSTGGYANAAGASLEVKF